MSKAKQNKMITTHNDKVTVVFGHSKLKTFQKEENGCFMFYGYRIDYDKSGVETNRTEPTMTGRANYGKQTTN